MLITKSYIFSRHDNSEIGLGVIKRLYFRNSKNLNNINFTFSTTRGNCGDILPTSKVYVTFKYTEPSSVGEKKSIEHFFNKIYKIGKLEEYNCGHLDENNKIFRD